MGAQKRAPFRSGTGGFYLTPYRKGKARPAEHNKGRSEDRPGHRRGQDFWRGGEVHLQEHQRADNALRYICALQPGRETARVQIHANSLRNDRQRLVKDQIDALLGAVISRVASKEMRMEGGEIFVQDLIRGEGAQRAKPRYSSKWGIQSLR